MGPGLQAQSVASNHFAQRMDGGSCPQAGRGNRPARWTSRRTATSRSRSGVAQTPASAPKPIPSRSSPKSTSSCGALAPACPRVGHPHIALVVHVDAMRPRVPVANLVAPA